MATERDRGCSCSRCFACSDPALRERLCACFLAGALLAKEAFPWETKTVDGPSLDVRGVVRGSHGNRRPTGAGRR